MATDRHNTPAGVISRAAPFSLHIIDGSRDHPVRQDCEAIIEILTHNRPVGEWFMERLIASMDAADGDVDLEDTHDLEAVNEDGTDLDHGEDEEPDVEDDELGDDYDVPHDGYARVALELVGGVNV